MKCYKERWEERFYDLQKQKERESYEWTITCISRRERLRTPSGEQGWISIARMTTGWQTISLHNFASLRQKEAAKDLQLNGITELDVWTKTSSNKQLRTWRVSEDGIPRSEKSRSVHIKRIKDVWAVICIHCWKPI